MSRPAGRRFWWAVCWGLRHTRWWQRGHDSVKGMFTLVGLLQSIVLIMCAIVLFKYGKKCYYLKNSGYIDRCEDELSTAEQEEEAELLADVR